MSVKIDCSAVAYGGGAVGPANAAVLPVAASLGGKDDLQAAAVLPDIAARAESSNEAPAIPPPQGGAGAAASNDALGNGPVDMYVLMQLIAVLSMEMKKAYRQARYDEAQAEYDQKLRAADCIEQSAGETFKQALATNISAIVGAGADIGVQAYSFKKLSDTNRNIMEGMQGQNGQPPRYTENQASILMQKASTEMNMRSNLASSSERIFQSIGALVGAGYGLQAGILDAEGKRHTAAADLNGVAKDDAKASMDTEQQKADSFQKTMQDIWAATHQTNTNIIHGIA